MQAYSGSKAASALRLTYLVLCTGPTSLGIPFLGFTDGELTLGLGSASTGNQCMAHTLQPWRLEGL